MRTLLVILLLTPAFAFAGEREAFVKTESARLQAGPGKQFPDTAIISRGMRVRVHHDEGDFYAVQPPAGCISWVRMSYVQLVKPNETAFPCAAIVDANGLAKLQAGRVGEAKPLGVERTTLPDGTILTIVGPKVEVNGMKWYPVASPEDDFRYVLKSQIELGNPVESKFVVRSPQMDTPTVANGLAASIPAPAGGNWTHPKWIDAQRAERSGDFDTAERTYLELAKEMNKPGGTEKLAEDCYARVHDLRERRRRLGGRTSQALPANERRDSRDVIPVKAEAVANESRWEGPGTLYTSALRLNGEKLYALQSNPNSVITYALPGKGVDLARRTGQIVRLEGTVVPLAGYPGKTVMTVTNVEAAR